MTDLAIPTFDGLMNPLLQALRLLGGSGSIEEIYAKTVEVTGLSEDVLAQLHDPDKSSLTEVGYRLAWARTYLKKYGLLDNSSRGVWSLTEKAKNLEKVDSSEVVRFVRALDKQDAPKKRQTDETARELSEEERWKDKLSAVLTTKLDPSGFERLVQRILRESGFIHVEVTGRTGDGGIDGKGIARIHGFMSFHVLFQCKRYKGSVSAGEIRDFRGAMVGRADNLRRVLLMFKQYGQNIAYLYGRAGYQAFRGASPEERAEARRLLAGMLTVQFAAAGALGLPFVGAVASILGAMMNGFGGDDEKRDWEVEFRNWLAGTVGKDAGEALSHGLPRLVLGWDLASRIGQNDLFIRAPNREQEGRDAYFAWMQALAGPVAGYALNGYLGLSDIARGVGSLNRGLMMRGTEELMPAAIRNPLRALRYQVEEGVRTRGGEKQIEVTPFEKLGQALGFTPRRVAEMYEGVSAVKNRQHGIELRRGELLDQFAAAVRERDLRGIGEAMRGIQGFNARNPGAAISQETIQRSLVNRQRREAGMREGVSVPSSLSGLS